MNKALSSQCFGSNPARQLEVRQIFSGTLAFFRHLKAWTRLTKPSKSVPPLATAEDGQTRLQNK